MENVGFRHIFVLWTLVVTVFGFFYHYLAGAGGTLVYSLTGKPVEKLLDSIYFSFITATTTGFGDILPHGYFKQMAIAEVIFGLLLLALLTSKLVSIKQDAILNEVYDISFSERINRLRSSLFLFRQNSARILERVEEGIVRRRELNELHAYIASLMDTLDEVLFMINKAGKNEYVKDLDAVTLEIILNSVLRASERLLEVIAVLVKRNITWKRDVLTTLVQKCMEKTDYIFGRSLRTLKPGILAELMKEKDSIHVSITQALNKVYQDEGLQRFFVRTEIVENGQES